MKEQIELAGATTLKETNDKILSKKDIWYVYGVIINQLCVDLNDDTEDLRIKLLILLEDLNLNIAYEMNKYLKDSDERYNSSINMRLIIRSLGTKIHKLFGDKSKGFFADIRVRCTLGSFRHVIELKGYLANLKEEF